MGEYSKMKTNSSPPHAERWFVVVSAAVLVLILVLALWFSTPMHGEEKPKPDTVPLAQAAQVDLNTADIAALCTLPGIGEQKAKAIIAYREENGPFKSLSELEQVSGITAQIIDQWGRLAVLG